MKIVTATVFVALISNGLIVWAQPEDCGAYPTGLSALFGDAKEKFEACNRRRNEAQRNSVEKTQKEGQTQLDNSREACMNAVRKLSSQPSTLSFDYAPRYEIANGLNASGLDFTDGGYSVKLSGSDVNGRFRVMCYMDKSFRVTHVK